MVGVVSTKKGFVRLKESDVATLIGGVPLCCGGNGPRVPSVISLQPFGVRLLGLVAILPFGGQGR